MFANFDKLHRVLHMKESSAFLVNSPSGAYNLLHRADFPRLHMHVNSRLLIMKETLRKWMEQNMNDMT